MPSGSGNVPGNLKGLHDGLSDHSAKFPDKSMTPPKGSVDDEACRSSVVKSSSGGGLAKGGGRKY
jgi:hypothetical protein